MAIEIILFISLIINIILWLCMVTVSDENETLLNINEYLRSSNDKHVNTFNDMQKENADLQAFKDHHTGLFAIDRNPKDVSIEFIRKNSYQIK